MNFHPGMDSPASTIWRVALRSVLPGRIENSTVGAASSFGDYCSPKGRMLANFLLWREEAGFHMALSRDIASSVQKHISRFVLRAKVKVSDASEKIVMAGAAGPKAARALSDVFPDLPKEPNEASRQPDTSTVIKLKDGRYLMALMPSSAVALRQRLAEVSRSLGAHSWAVL